MWSPNRKVWSPKDKNVESRILHLICSLTVIFGEIKINCQSHTHSTHTLRSEAKRQEFSTLSREVNTLNFRTPVLASSSSLDNPRNSSQGVLDVAFTVLS